MHPRVLKVDEDPSAVCAEAGKLVRAGGLIVFPTETFYGLAALPSSEDAVKRLVNAKGRPDGKPIPLIAADAKACGAIAEVPILLQTLTAAFWPGPLTITARPARGIRWPAPLLGGGTTLGIRVPGHAAARTVAAAAGGTVTATSANLAGEPPAANIAELSPTLLCRVDLILDAGQLAGGAPSTVVGIRDAKVEILRPGVITSTELAAAGAGDLAEANAGAPRC